MVKAGDGLIQEMVGSFHSRRDMVLARLRELDGVVCPEPEGAFYLFPDVSAYYGRTAPDGRAIDGSEALCFHLLERHDVALVPGSAFGADYGARLSYAAAPADLETAMALASPPGSPSCVAVEPVARGLLPRPGSPRYHRRRARRPTACCGGTAAAALRGAHPADGHAPRSAASAWALMCG